MPRRLWASLLLSLLLHFVGLIVVDRSFLADRELRAFRARLVAAPRFQQPSRLQTAAPTPLSVEMEYARAPSGAPDAPSPAMPLVTELAEVAQPVFLESYDPTVPRRAAAELTVETLPDPTAPTVADTASFDAMELLRIEDMIRSDKERAVIIPDVYSRRDTRGFVKFTPLRLDGAWSYGLDATQSGRPVLADLARYVSDYTRVHAELRGSAAEYFDESDLKKDPVHFLFPGIRRSGRSGPRLALASHEQVLVGEYLREGGFLFVDAGQGPEDRRFLRDMIVLLKEIVGVEGQLFPLPANHAVYHAFYSYENGFPGERKRLVRQIPGSPWYYPDRAPCSALDPRGLYGVEWSGETVAIISDLELHRRWSGLESSCAEFENETAPPAGGEEGAEEAASPVTSPFLQAATNIVFHALTRPGGVAVRREGPAWGRRRVDTGRPQGLVEEQLAVEDHDLLDELEASLAFLRAPSGKVIGDGGLRLRIKGYEALEVADGRRHGVLVRNLAAGRLWVEVEYGGEYQGVEVEIQGGTVTTVVFALRGFGPWTSLSIEPLTARFAVADWMRRFDDLHYDEIFAPK